MGGISLVAAGGMALTALWMVLTPGPNMIYLVSRSISQGRIAGLVSLAGTGVGLVIYMAMANLGLSAVFVAVPWVYIGLKAAGVVYLLWLAWNALRPNGAACSRHETCAPISRSRSFGWVFSRTCSIRRPPSRTSR